MASSQNLSRKRPAPGASPMNFPQQIPQAQNGFGSGIQQPLTDDQFLNWGNDSQPPGPYTNAQMYNVPQNGYNAQPNPNVGASNQLARRPMNQLVARPPQSTDQWVERAPTPPAQDLGTSWSDDIDELLEKAQVAKKEAQSKRKQIPPFVLKLHSFLENPKNTDLIRWSEDGKSFIVLNEDEFANRLIPELFKHNNYASFVRQLNMYGFHKKVGLSDNSMRASERKAKSPSEYWNPFFRRGYPDLLWLIQKPKNQSTQKGKTRPKSEDVDDEDEFIDEMDPVDGSRPRPQITMGPAPPGQALTTEQMQTVQRELSMIRRQQQQITQMLGQLKREHDALVDQANDYHNKHSRHEHSINAILTFLATLYNRSLQNHEGAADIAKMFANTLQQEKGGNVVDMDNFPLDIPEGQIGTSNQPFKKQRLLLTDGSHTDSRAKTMSPASSVQSPINKPTRKPSQPYRPQSVPNEANPGQVGDAGMHGTNLQSPADSATHNMMSLIHNSNARNSGPNTPTPDFSNVINDLENSGAVSPISSAQKENMLRMFNDQSKNQFSGHNTALVSPSRTHSQNQFDTRLASTKADLDSLAALQAQQDKSVENLTSLLQPLSPSGSIPGIGDGQDVPPPPLNIDDFLTNHDYFSDLPTDANGNPNFNFNDDAYNTNGAAAYNFNDDEPLFGDMDNSFDQQNNTFLNTSDAGDAAAGRVESVASSEATTPKHSSSFDDATDSAMTTSRGKGRKLSTVEESQRPKRRKPS